MIIVGVNGGGTKTEAMACDGYGKVIGKGLAGSSNKDNIGIEEAVRNIKMAVSQATKKAKEEPEIICIALAGINTERAREQMTKRLSKEYKNLVLEHDAFAELYGATRGKPGVIVIAGTGSMVLGYDGEKRYRRCDNGYFLGDEGSAYFIGKEGLKMTAKMLIEDMEESDMMHDIMKHFGFTSADDLMEWVYSDKNTVTAVSELAQIIHTCAENGDKVAESIIKTASTNVANAAVELAKKVSVNTVYIKGGVARSDFYYSNFSQILKKNGIEAHHLNKSMSEGALFIAADSIGVNIDLQE